MKYRCGTVVEVQINDIGFEQSFYQAVVVSYSRRYGYLVRFETLLEENEITPLTGYAEEKHIRPVPDPLPITNFSAGDVVETNVRDGWWIGRVIRRVADMLLISYPEHNEEKIVEDSCVRLHQEYLQDGDLWVFEKH